MQSLDLVCPVCRRQEDTEITGIPSAVPQRPDGEFENRTHCDDAFWVTCRSCGEFCVTRCDYTNLTSPRLRSGWSIHQLSSLLREQTIRNLPRFWLRYGMDPYGPLQRNDLAPIDLDELVQRWPRTVPERLDRTLCNFARLSPTAGYPVQYGKTDCSLAFAETPGEFIWSMKCLIERAYLQETSDLTATVTLTAKGWERYEELTNHTPAPENPVFVAMWFGGEEHKGRMDEAYEQGIRPGVEQAGYKAVRVDLVQHNDWIMDQIFGAIRIAPFVIADCTGHRNGVYFEAGFARGLGIPVIHTCEEKEFGLAHFDTQQLNHVLWRTPGELREKLRYRILGTVGPGPHHT